MFRYIYITQQSCASKGSRPGAPLATGLVQPAASGLDKPRVADDYKHCSLLTLTFQRNCLMNMFSSAKAEWKWISPGLCDDAGVCHCSAKSISLRWSKQLGVKIESKNSPVPPMQHFQEIIFWLFKSNFHAMLPSRCTLGASFCQVIKGEDSLWEKRQVLQMNTL